MATIATSPFDAIAVYNQLDIELVQDSTMSQGIHLIGPENVIPNIEFEVQNGVLSIRDKNPCRWFRKYGRLLIQINIKDLDVLSVYDNAQVFSQDSIHLDDLVLEFQSVHDINLKLHVGTLELHHREVGTVNLSGYAAVFIPSLYSSGKLHAENLQGDFTFVYHYGINEAHVKPYKELEARIYNSGSIFYHAQPIGKLDKVGNGAGELIFIP